MTRAKTLSFCACLLALLLGEADLEAAPRIVRVGVFPAAPLVMLDKGKPTGLFVDLLDYLAKESGWKLQYLPDRWDRQLEKLRSGEIDLLPAIGYTEERSKIYDFSSNPIYIDSGVVFTSPQRPIHTIYDLKGKKIAALRGSIFTANFLAYVRSFGLDCSLVPMDDNEAVMEAIESGKADAGVCIYSLGTQLAKSYRVAVTPISFSPIALAYAAPKGRNADLLGRIDELIPPMLADKASVYSKLYAKWTEPTQEFRVPAWIWWTLLALAASGLLLLLWTFSLRSQVRKKTIQLEIEAGETREAKEKIQEELAEKEVLLRELYHRTKNSLLVIDGLIALQADEYPEDEELARVVRNTDERIQAMALVHEMLYQTKNLARLSVDDYIARLSRLILEEYSVDPERIRLECSVESFELPFDVAIPLGMVVNELLTNSLRYAFPGDSCGAIRLSIRRTRDGEYELDYADDGVGFPSGYDFKAPKSLGLKLIYSIGEDQLRGKIELRSGRGVGCRLLFAPARVERKL